MVRYGAQFLYRNVWIAKYMPSYVIHSANIISVLHSYRKVQTVKILQSYKFSKIENNKRSAQVNFSIVVSTTDEQYVQSLMRRKT
jgi:hypothetical protein